jgi:hypothetical protein
MLCQQEKNYIRGGGWRLVGCGFFGVLQIGSAMQQSFSALALALSRADIFVKQAFYLFMYSSGAAASVCAIVLRWWCGTDNTRLSEKGTNRAETNPTKNGEKISHATCTWSPFAISEKTPFHWLVTAFETIRMSFSYLERISELLLWHHGAAGIK